METSIKQVLLSSFSASKRSEIILLKEDLKELDDVCGKFEGGDVGWGVVCVWRGV